MLNKARGWVGERLVRGIFAIVAILMVVLQVFAVQSGQSFLHFHPRRGGMLCKFLPGTKRSQA